MTMISGSFCKNCFPIAGVSEDRIQGFFSRIDSFSESVREEWLTTGFEEVKPLDTKYDPYEMQDE